MTTENKENIQVTCICGVVNILFFAVYDVPMVNQSRMMRRPGRITCND